MMHVYHQANTVKEVEFWHGRYGMKALIAILVISLARTCQAPCIPCTQYQVLLLHGAEGVIHEQISVQLGEFVAFHCTSNSNITHGNILINGSIPDFESIKTSRSDLAIVLRIRNITKTLDGAILTCVANFSTSCEVCTSNMIRLHIQEAATEPPGTPHLPAADPIATTEVPPTSNQSTSSEKNGVDEANVELNITEGTTTDSSTAARIPYEIVLPIIIPVLVILGVLVSLILCYKVIKRRSQKGKIQHYVLPWCGGPRNLNGDTNSTKKDDEVAVALNEVEGKLDDQDGPQYRNVTDPLLQLSDTLSDTDTEKIEDTASDIDTEKIKDTASDTGTEKIKDTSSDTGTEKIEDTSSDTGTEKIDDTASDTGTETIEDTSSDAGTEKIEDTASDSSTGQIDDIATDGTEQHGTKAKKLCSAGSAVNSGDPVLEDNTACQDEDADNVLEVAAGQAGTSLDDEDPLQTKSTAKDEVCRSQGSNGTQKEISSQYELVLNDIDSSPGTAEETSDSKKLHVFMETNQKSGSETVYTPVSRAQDFVQYEYMQGSIVHPQHKELTSNEDALAVPPAQMCGSTKSDLHNSRRCTQVVPRTPRGSAADRSGTEQTQIPHGSSGTSSPEDSGSSGVKKSDGNGSASSDRMGHVAGMELPIIDTRSIAGQIIPSDQVCNIFSSTTGN